MQPRWPSEGSSLGSGAGRPMASQIHSAGSPVPPPGVPPPRPPGLLRAELPQREDVVSRSRNVRFDGLPKIRSLSYDDAITRQASVLDDEAEADAANPFGRPQPHGQGHHILVAVRCRPLHPQEVREGGRAIVKVVPSSSVVVLEDPQTTAADDYLRLNKSKERRYAFDEAFNEIAGTRQVYEKTTRFLIAGVLQGFNATVFAYGATGAGKTHTMLGNPSEPGIMMLTLLDLFSEVDGQREERHFEVKCSFLEVYNENIRDLLRPDGDYLDIREDPVKGMCVAGISEVGGLESANEIMSLLHQANRHRTTEATGANVTSSRSHAVLQVVVEQRDKTAGIVAQVNLGKLSMIDLAGSERASQTNNKGMRMIEGANINRSLLALGNCITALSSAVSFVPYRDSKMTRLLKDSLGGNCRTVMIANCSPNHYNYEDTHNTLKYANRAKNIKTKAVRNVVRVNCHVSKYTEIIKELRGEIAELKGKLANAPEVKDGGPMVALFSDGTSVSGEDQGGNVFGGAALGAADATKWKQELMQNFEERVRIKRKLIDLAQTAQNQMVQKSHAQVGISQWESMQVRGEGSGDGGSAREDVGTPRPIRHLQEKLRNIKTEMAYTEETTAGLEEMLVENQKVAERLQAELPKRVQNKDMRAFLGLISRIYVMEVENMDLQEMNDVTAPLINQKELEAEALRLQIQMRDRMIEDQDQLLSEDGAALLQKPEGWLEVPAKPSRRNPYPLTDIDEDEGDRSDGAPAAMGVDMRSPDERVARDASGDRHQVASASGRPRLATWEYSPNRPPVTLPPLSPGRGQLNRHSLPAGAGEQASQRARGAYDASPPPGGPPAAGGSNNASPPPGGPLAAVGSSAAPGGRRSRPPSASPLGAAQVPIVGITGSGGYSATPVAEAPERAPLDIAGRGLGHGRPPRLTHEVVEAAPVIVAPSPAVGSTPPRPQTPLELRGYGQGGGLAGGEQTRLPQSTSPAPAGATPPTGGQGRLASDSEHPSDMDVTQRGRPPEGLPVVEGHPALPADSARKATRGTSYGGPYATPVVPESRDARGRVNGGPSSKRRSRKNRRGADAGARAREREREREQAERLQNLQIEASRLHRDDSPGSDSEREVAPKDPPLSVHAAAAAERKGILDKLNRRAKPAGGPKHLS